jgi:glycerophosphoryl diester phosphodiesterase
MSFEYDDPIIHMPRKGTQDSPFRDVEESLIIDNSGKVILNEYPNRFRRVIVTDDKGNNLYEVKSGTPDENGFFVDYSSKTITFNKAHIGKQFHFKYSGEGNSFIPVNSIYTERDGLKVTETLDQLTETTKQARDKANEQASYAKNQGNYAKEQGQKAQDVADNTRYVEPYNDKKLYHKNNIVTHNGNSYMAKKDTIGNEPTGYGDDEYWGLVGFRGQDGVGSVSVKKHTFIATEGQKVFKLPFSYEPLKNRTRVYVGGAPQNTPENYEETNENTITLTEGVRQGTTVYVEVFSTEFDDRIAEFDEKMSHMNNSLDELDGAIQDATTHSDYAKTQGEYAKVQGDYAKEKGGIAADVADNLEYVEPYNPSKQYTKNNIVSFNGNSFIAKKDNIGSPPPTDLEFEIENEYWGLVGRKGDDGTGTVHTIRDEFIAIEGQKVFELSRTYDQFQNRTRVIIDGVPQRFPEAYEETTPNIITLKEGVYEGAKVVVEYFSKSVPLESDIATTVYNHTNEISLHALTIHEHSSQIIQMNEGISKLEDNKADKTEVEFLKKKIGGVKISDLVLPTVIAHRGAKNILPESSLEAYRSCVSMGLPIEIDVRMTSDGVLVVNHDSTVNRTTNLSGNVSDYSIQGFKTLKITELGTNLTGTPVTLEELFAEFGNKAVYIIESKIREAAKPIVDLILTYGLEENCIFSSYNLDDLNYSLDNNIPTMLLVSKTSFSNYSPIDIKNSGIDYVTVDKNVDKLFISECVSNGLIVGIYTINRRYEFDYFLNLGVSMFISDDPLWVSRKSKVLSRDSFRQKAFYHGQFSPEKGEWGDGNRGEFDGIAHFGWLSASQRDVSVGDIGKDISMQGWAGELNEIFTLKLDVFPRELTTSNRWAGIAFCTQYDYWDDTDNELNQGYSLIIRESGQMQLYKRSEDSIEEIGSIETDPMNTSGRISIQIEVNEDQIIITRTNQSSANSIIVNDSDFRGGYLHFKRFLTGVTFGNVYLS